MKCEGFKSTGYCAYVSEVIVTCLTTGFLGSVLEYFENEINFLQTSSVVENISEYSLRDSPQIGVGESAGHFNF
jgi:hypothetical protein